MAETVIPCATGETGPRPDLYIGLVCPAGTDLTDVKNQLQAQLAVMEYNYARHIISSGIREVVFVEPYPKSMTEQLYGDEIEVVHGPTGNSNESGQRVKFRPFQGVAPVLYQRVFAYRDRKDDDGTIATWKPKAAEPVGAIYGIERPSVETAASNVVADVLETAKSLYAAKLGEMEHGSAETVGTAA